MSFNFKAIKNEILSPGNIFWKKRSGDLVLITQKGDVINHDLIQKLQDAHHDIVMNDQIDPHQRDKLNSIYEKYCSELLMRDKIGWRDQLIELMRVDFIVNQNSQFEFNQLAWDFFSTFSNDDIASFIKKDSELFKRNLTIASNYTFTAFVLGYYEPRFLSNLFTKTLKNLMELGNSTNVLSFKEKIEYLRMQDSFHEDDYESMKEIANEDLLSSTVLFERYDGSGLRKINAREMTDLEVVLVALNRKYGFESSGSENVFLEISRDNFNCGPRLLKTLQKLLAKKDKEIVIAA